MFDPGLVNYFICNEMGGNCSNYFLSENINISVIILNKFQSVNCDRHMTSTDLFLLLGVLFLW